MYVNLCQSTQPGGHHSDPRVVGTTQIAPSVNLCQSTQLGGHHKDPKVVGKHKLHHHCCLMLQISILVLFINVSHLSSPADESDSTVLANVSAPQSTKCQYGGIPQNSQSSVSGT